MPNLGSVVNCIFPSFPRRRESRIRTNSVVFGPKFIRIPTLAGMTADLTTPPSKRASNPYPVTAPSEADDTSLAYLANTPVV